MVQMQLDACSSGSSTLASMSLEVSGGNCKITSRVLASGGTGLQISFPCSQSSATHANLAGPALNLWAALSKAAPASCSVTTLNPALYYKRVPPAYYYGYEVSKLACKELDAAAASAALKVGDQLTAPRQGARMGVQYGLWLVPELRTPAQGGADAFSTAAQSCRLAVTTTGRSYLSKQHYPCNLVEDPEALLGSGKCFGSPEHGA